MKSGKVIKEVQYVSQRALPGYTTTADEAVVGEFKVAEFTKASLRHAHSVALDASRETLFFIVSNPKEWMTLFPWIQNITVDCRQVKFPGSLGAYRHCEFGNGLNFVEHVVAWHPPTMYAYIVSDGNPFGLTDHLGLVMFHSDAKKRTILTWQQYFNHSNLQAMVGKMDSSLSLAIQNLMTRFHGEPLETYVNFRG